MSIQYMYSNKGIVAVISYYSKKTNESKIYIRGFSPNGTIQLYDPNEEEIELYERVPTYYEHRCIKDKLRHRKTNYSEIVPKEVPIEHEVLPEEVLKLNKRKQKEVENVIKKLQDKKLQSYNSYSGVVIVDASKVK